MIKLKPKTKVIEQTVVNTMVGPLWARAFYGQKYPEILTDPDAPHIFEKIMSFYPDSAYEFSVMEKFVDEMAGLGFIIRARTFEDLIKEFMKTNPEGIIVNIGCGLDTTFFRVDNGTITWYDLDLPEALEYRKKFIENQTRNIYIAKSLFDYTWFDDIQFDAETIAKKGIFFFAAGLINYFKEDQVIDFITKISSRFPDAMFAFDNPSSSANKIVNKKMKKLKVTGSDFYFAVDDPVSQLESYSPHIKVVDWFSFYARIPRNPKWKPRTKLKIYFADKLKLFKFIVLKFQ